MKTKPAILMLLSLALVVVVAAVVLFVTASAQPPFRAVRLSPDAPDEVAKQALKYTQTYMHVLSGTPEVVHVSTVTGAELPTLGLQEVSSNHPLMLVIVRGDIDVSGAWPGSDKGSTRFNYINYVFDLDSGVPTQIVAEINGDALRRVLNPAERLDPPKPPFPAGTPLPDDVVAPTIAPTVAPY